MMTHISETGVFKQYMEDVWKRCPLTRGNQIKNETNGDLFGQLDFWWSLVETRAIGHLWAVKVNAPINCPENEINKAQIATNLSAIKAGKLANTKFKKLLFQFLKMCFFSAWMTKLNFHSQLKKALSCLILIATKQQLTLTLG